jgi:hypothetical protein
MTSFEIVLIILIIVFVGIMLNKIFHFNSVLD